jgi:hypothetical protein
MPAPLLRSAPRSAGRPASHLWGRLTYGPLESLAPAGPMQHSPGERASLRLDGAQREQAQPPVASWLLRQWQPWRDPRLD